MTDRVHPSAKPNGNGVATAGATNPPVFPPAKTHLPNPTRPPYRPRPSHHRPRRSRRSCLCLCCFWSFLLLTALLLLAAIAGCVAYVLYSPRRPAFSVATVRISRFKLSTTPSDGTTHLTSSLSLTISAKNPNKKLTYFYDPMAISAVSGEVLVANGSFPSFTSYPNNVTLVRSSLSTTSQFIDADSASSLKSDLKKKNGLPLKIVMDTKVVVKMDKLKGKKVAIRVTCEDIHGVLPKGKSPAIASISEPKCKVDLRIMIWKWAF